MYDIRIVSNFFTPSPLLFVRKFEVVLARFSLCMDVLYGWPQRGRERSH